MWLSPKLAETPRPIPGYVAVEDVGASERLFTCELAEALSTPTVYKVI